MANRYRLSDYRQSKLRLSQTDFGKKLGEEGRVKNTIAAWEKDGVPRVADRLQIIKVIGEAGAFKDRQAAYDLWDELAPDDQRDPSFRPRELGDLLNSIFRTVTAAPALVPQRIDPERDRQSEARPAPTVRASGSRWDLQTGQILVVFAGVLGMAIALGLGFAFHDKIAGIFRGGMIAPTAITASSPAITASPATITPSSLMTTSPVTAATATRPATATRSGTSVVAPSPGRAGSPPPLTGAQLNGLDPAQTGCGNGAGTIERINVTDAQGVVIGWIELRYSGFCRTAWARIENTTGHDDVPLRSYLRDADGNILAETDDTINAKGMFGDMWYAPVFPIHLRSCGMIGDSPETCTALH